MKRVVVVGGFLASLVFASNTYAGPFSAVDIIAGSYSAWSGSCAGLNLPKCEESQLEAFLGGGDYDLRQIQTNNGAGWVTNGANPNIVSFDLLPYGLQGIAAFAIKIGGGGGNGFDIFVYQNLPELRYAVIDLKVLGDAAGKPVNVGSISHIAVPEPSSLLLLGVGALTAAAARRRQRARQGQVISRA